MPRNVDETEWLTRSTAPLRLARFIQTRVSSRRLQILSCAVCRLVAGPISLSDCARLIAAERFAFGELDGASYRKLIDAEPADECANGEDAERAIHSALSGNIVAGFVNAVEWVLESFRRYPDESATGAQQLCDLMRELVGNPFRVWTNAPPWLAHDVRIAPDGTAVVLSRAAMDLAGEIDSRGRFDLMPVLADELEGSGCHDLSLLDHCRHGLNHQRGCWAIDLVLGRE